VNHGGKGGTADAGRKANNNNNYLIRVGPESTEDEGTVGAAAGREGKGARNLTRACNICNGPFYSSDLSADTELMAAEISRGSERRSVRSAEVRKGREVEKGGEEDRER